MKKIFLSIALRIEHDDQLLIHGKVIELESKVCLTDELIFFLHGHSVTY